MGGSKIDAIIELLTANQRTYYENGGALKLTCMQRLYEGCANSFRGFLEMVSISQSQAYRLIDAHDIVNDIVWEKKVSPIGDTFEHENGKVSPIGDTSVLYLDALEKIAGMRLPRTESQARPMKPLEPEHRRAVWRIIHAEYQRTGARITAAGIVDAVDQFTGKREKKPDDPAQFEQLSFDFEKLFENLTSQIRAEASAGWQHTSRDAVVMKLKALTQYVKGLSEK